MNWLQRRRNFFGYVTKLVPNNVIINRAMLEDEEYINEIIKNKSLVSYQALVEKYENRVFTLCYKIIKGREDAEEVAQDVFVTGFGKLKELKDRRKFPNWILKIAYSKSIDWVRKKRLATISLSASNEGYFKEERTPVKDTIDRNRKEIISRAIHQLEPVEASIITLFYIQDRPVREVAEITGLSVGNVKVKLFRARISLKTILANLLQTDLQDFIEN